GGRLDYQGCRSSDLDPDGGGSPKERVDPEDAEALVGWPHVNGRHVWVGGHAQLRQPSGLEWLGGVESEHARLTVPWANAHREDRVTPLVTHQACPEANPQDFVQGRSVRDECAMRRREVGADVADDLSRKVRRQ